MYFRMTWAIPPIQAIHVGWLVGMFSRMENVYTGTHPLKAFAQLIT